MHKLPTIYLPNTDKDTSSLVRYGHEINRNKNIIVISYIYIKNFNF